MEAVSVSRSNIVVVVRLWMYIRTLYKRICEGPANVSQGVIALGSSMHTCIIVYSFVWDRFSRNAFVT